MMQLSILLYTIVFLLVLPATMVSPCLYPQGWEPRNFTTRAQDAEIILMGQVTTMTPLPDMPDPPVGFSASFSVQCVYRAPSPADIGDSVTVAPVNFSMSCSQTKVAVGRDYLIFLKMNSGDGLMMTPDEVNEEEAQFPVDEEKLEYLRAAVGAGRGGVSPGCPGSQDSEDIPTDRQDMRGLDDGGNQPDEPIKYGRPMTSLPPKDTGDATTKAQEREPDTNGRANDLVILPFYFLIGIGVVTLSGDMIY